MWERVRRFLLENNEFWGIPLGVLLFLGCPVFLRIIDASAGSYDPVLLQSLLYGIAAFMFIKGVVWLVLWMDFPALYHYLDAEVDQLFNKRESHSSRHWVALGIYALYLVLITILVVGVL